jgi:hypothetical protein
MLTKFSGFLSALPGECILKKKQSVPFQFLSLLGWG